MANLQEIITRIETEFNLKIYGSYDRDQQIENVQYLTSTLPIASLSDHFTLYIGDIQEQKQGPDAATLLLVGCNVQEPPSRGLYLCQQVSLYAVGNCILQMIFQDHQQKIKKEEIFQILHSGYGIQSMIDSARTYLDNPITICTTSFSVLAVSPTDDSNNNLEIHNKKIYLKNSALQNMRNSNILERLFNTYTPFVTCFTDEPGVEYLFCSIHIKQASVGYICLRNVIRPFHDKDMEFVIDLSKMLSIEMQKNNFYSQRTGLEYEYFMTDLLEQNIDNMEFALGRMAQLGQKPRKYYWIFSFSFGTDTTNQMNPNYYIDQLLGIFRRGMAFFYKGSLVLLLTSNHENPFETVAYEKLQNFLQLNQMYVAISYRYKNILDTCYYYNQTMFLLKHRNCIPNDRIYVYGDNYQKHLLAAAQETLSLNTLLHPDILLLQEYDGQHGTEYIKTLQAFFHCSRNAVKASAFLHIHKSTFFYRLGKIEALTDFTIENASLLFAYELSFHILEQNITEQL